ncbi:hypothetical protein B484DRAFT_338383, partial [Ochromonadaceae sp. CCMP2298]
CLYVCCYLSAYDCVCVCVCMCMCLYAYVFICVCVYMRMCLYVYVGGVYGCMGSWVNGWSMWVYGMSVCVDLEEASS